ncbi:MAG: flagellar basal-body MS-ring/collar protein FliF [Acutalibacter sp.]|jgi:flagellar M-ring protein FliF
MGEKAKAVLEKGKTLLKKVPKFVFILAGVVVVIVAVVAAVVMNNKDYTVLFTGLGSEEASEIITYLNDNGITDYRVENTDTILVPEGQEAQLKAKLLMEGYPESGYSYSTYYDHVSALSTESERNTAYLLLLQDRMSAVVRNFDGVKDAVVNINQGEDNSYILDQNNMVDASASVFVTMDDPNEKLTDNQADAIRRLVARSVQGLEVESVEISDSMGHTYGGSSELDESTDLSALKLQLEEENNNKIRAEILQVLEPLFGRDNVAVGVNCTVDVNRSTEDSTTYSLPDGSQDGQGLIGSEVYNNKIVRNADDTTGGTVGTESNADISTYVQEELTPDGTEKEISSEGQNDYLNNSSTVHEERVAGTITDCMVSVSINTDTAGNVDVNQIRTHVARAAGITDEQAQTRISILPRSFYTEGGNQNQNGLVNGNQFQLPIPVEVALAISAGLFLLLVALIVMMIVLHRRRKRKEREAALAAAAAQQTIPMEIPLAEPQEGADVMSLETEKSMELRKDVRQFAEDNPEIAAQMVRTLLKGGGSGG